MLIEKYNSKKLLKHQACSIARPIAFQNAIEPSMFAMHAREARKLRLQQLNDDLTLTEIAVRITDARKRRGKAGPKGNYLDRYLSQIVTGLRGMGNRLARDIESAFERPEGWMDHVGASSQEVNELLSVWGKFPETEQTRILEELKIRLRVLKDKHFIRAELGNQPPSRPPKNQS